MKYTVNNLKIRRVTESDFAFQYCEVTTAPIGVSNTIHLRGKELWTWGCQGRYQRRIFAYDTLKEASTALHKIHYEEALANSLIGNAPSLFDTLHDAVSMIVEDSDATTIAFAIAGNNC